FFTARKGIRRRRRLVEIIRPRRQHVASGQDRGAPQRSWHSVDCSKTESPQNVPNFHDKYGNIVLLGGALFCVSIWGYVATQTGIEWNLSPVGRVTPKEWREK
ncbi:cytochrome c oxidase subunit 7B, mitochondrial, partial [Chelydra serpentina]